MSERFLKLIPSKEAMWLLKNKGHAFRLLTIIAESARRYSGDPDGLEIGESLIGDWKGYDMSEQNYRTAKEILEKRQHIKIIETNRTRKKTTTGVTTIGTKVKLLSSTVYDINLEDGNDRHNECPTTAQRLPNDELRSNKIYKKEKKRDTPKPPIEKLAFAEFVTFSKEEHQKLLDAHSPEKVVALIEILNSYKGSTGKTYDSDYHTMVGAGWVLKRYSEDKKNVDFKKKETDRRTKNIDGSPVSSPADGRF